MIDANTRSELNRALSKAIAYRNCGKHTEATAWAVKLVRLLDATEILNESHCVLDHQLLAG